MRFCASSSSSEIDDRPPTGQRSEIRSQRSVSTPNPQSDIFLALSSKLRALSSVPLAAARATTRSLLLPLLALALLLLAPAPSSLPFALSRISKRRQSRRLAPIARVVKARGRIVRWLVDAHFFSQFDDRVQRGGIDSRLGNHLEIGILRGGLAQMFFIHHQLEHLATILRIQQPICRFHPPANKEH